MYGGVPSLLSRDTGANVGVRVPPNGYMLFLGAGGEGTRTGPWWSCVAAAAAAAALREGGGRDQHFGTFNVQKQIVIHVIMQGISIRDRC